MKTLTTKSAKQLGVQSKEVSITHTIKMFGWDLEEGMQMIVEKVYFRNGETQLKGYVNGRDKIEEVSAMWTNVIFI